MGFSDEEYLTEEIELVASRLIHLADLKSKVLKHLDYASLIRLRDNLELLLFLLELERFCDYIQYDKELVKGLRSYKRGIKQAYKKVLRLLRKRKKALPPIVQRLIDEFGGTIE